MSPATTTESRRPLSVRQERVLRTLVLWIERKRCQPSYAELASVLGIASVQDTITEIAAKGWIGLTGAARALEIPQDVYDEIVTSETGASETGASETRTSETRTKKKGTKVPGGKSK